MWWVRGRVGDRGWALKPLSSTPTLSLETQNKKKNCQVQILNNMVRLHKVLLPFYSNFVLFYQHYKALLYVYFLFFSWYFFNIGSCELFCLVLWCELIYPRVILFVYSRAVPIEVNEWIILICETHVFDSVYSRWIDICNPPPSTQAPFPFHPSSILFSVLQQRYSMLSTQIQRMSISIKIVKFKTELNVLCVIFCPVWRTVGLLPLPR